MNIQKQTLRSRDTQLIVGLDFEWTKNYRIKNGNKPFCFSFVYFPAALDCDKIKKAFSFGFISQYITEPGEMQLLLKNANDILSQFLNTESVIVGHQLSSDIGVVLSSNKGKRLKAFEELRDKWRIRNEAGTNERRVFDSRYDIKRSLLKEKSRRLVDVCKEAKLDVTQPELSQSMTKMQNLYYESQSKSILEKLSVLNLRHSLSSALLFYYDFIGSFPNKTLNINKILHKNLKSHFEYIQSKEFCNLI